VLSHFALRKGPTKNVKGSGKIFRGPKSAFSIARNRVKRGDPSATLNPTALVNEAWLKLANSPHVASASCLHFKRIAARAMRQLLVEAARHLQFARAL